MVGVSVSALRGGPPRFFFAAFRPFTRQLYSCQTDDVFPFRWMPAALCWGSEPFSLGNPTSTRSFSPLVPLTPFLGISLCRRGRFRFRPLGLKYCPPKFFFSGSLGVLSFPGGLLPLVGFGKVNHVELHGCLFLSPLLASPLWRFSSLGFFPFLSPGCFRLFEPSFAHRFSRGISGQGPFFFFS